jgi:hypothetical protein
MVVGCLTTHIIKSVLLYGFGMYGPGHKFDKIIYHGETTCASVSYHIPIALLTIFPVQHLCTKP